MHFHFNRNKFIIENVKIDDDCDTKMEIFCFSSFKRNKFIIEEVKQR